MCSREKSHQCNERMTNEVIVWWQGIENLWTFHPVSGLVQIFGSSEEFRFQHTMCGPYPIDGYEINALLYYVGFFSALFRGGENLISKNLHSIWIYRCVTAHRSDEDNTNNCKITRKKWIFFSCEIGILHRISFAVSWRYSTATQFQQIEPTLGH